tara:strand:- start:31 stop:303 length:273 start_codon:yes stop_codon:yes gene_type:complete
MICIKLAHQYARRLVKMKKSALAEAIPQRRRHRFDLSWCLHATYFYQVTFLNGSTSEERMALEDNGYTRKVSLTAKMSMILIRIYEDGEG